MSLPDTDRNAAMRYKLRKLYEEDPEAFGYWIEQFGSAPDWRALLPAPEESRGRPQVTPSVLAFLLAEYRERPEGMTRSAFVADHAAQRVGYRTPYSVRRWGSAENVLFYLKKAERLAKDDRDFEKDVQFRQFFIKSVRRG